MGELLSHLAAFPYLGWVLGLLAFLVPLLALFPGREARRAVLSGVLATPFSLTAPAWVPSYWAPSRPLVLLGVGVEDVAASFIVGAAVWLLAFRRVEPAQQWPATATLIARFLGWTGLGVGVAVIALRAGIGPLPCSLLVAAVTGTAMLLLRPHLLRPALRAALLFPLVHWLGLACAYAAWPHFRSQWNGISGIDVLGVPVEEVVWATTTAFTWALFAGSVLGLQVAPREQPCFAEAVPASEAQG